MPGASEFYEDIHAKTEFEPQSKITYLGELSDFGLGNSVNGIPSELADASERERMEYGEKVRQSLSEVTDLHHYGCIDGRVCICNADGSRPDVRLRQVGGTGLLVEVALNSNSPVIRDVEDMSNLAQTIAVVESRYEDATKVRRSAHLGGCGGVKGAVLDGEAIANNQAIMSTVEAVMNHPDVVIYSDIRFDTHAAHAVSERAQSTSAWLRDNGWDGGAYVDGVMSDEPSGVEDLEVMDDEYHGHHEPALVYILNTGEKRYSLSDEKMHLLGVTPPFVVNLDASFDMAEALGDKSRESGLAEAAIANLAKHTAVANRLPSNRTPVYLLVV